MLQNNLLKMQLKRAFHNYGFLTSIFIATTIVVWQLVSLYGPINDEYYAYPTSVFNRWIGLEGITLASFLLFLLLPFLCMLPFGTQYEKDCRNGYMKNLAIKTDKSKIIFSYAFACFVSAFAITLYALFLSLWLNALVYPALLPEGSAQSFIIFAQGFMSDLFFYQPYLYCFVFSVLIALFQALLVLVGMSISGMFKSLYIVLVFPAAFCYIISFLFGLIGLLKFAPFSVFNPTQQTGTQTWKIIIAYYILLAAVSMIALARKSKQHELY